MSVCVDSEGAGAVPQPPGEFRRLLETVLDNATVAIFVMNDRQHCVYANRSAERLTGYKTAELLGRPLHDVIHHTRPDGRPYPLEECPIDRAFPQRMQEQGEEVFVHKDGSFYPVAYTASPLRNEEAEIIGTIIEVRDLRNQKETAEELRSEKRMLEVLNESGAALSSILDVDALIQNVTDAGVELSGAEFGAFFYNKTNENGESYTLYTLSGVPREAFANFPMPRNTEIFEPTFRGTKVMRSDDITRDSRYGKNPPYHGMPEGHLPVRSYLAVPVISRSHEVLGGLFFGHGRAGMFNERVERLIVGIAAQAAIAIDNARLYQAAQHEIEDRRRIQEQQGALLEELNHRVKNMLATVQSLAMHTERASDDTVGFRYAFQGRLSALARVHDLLTSSAWKGASLHEIVRSSLKDHAQEARNHVELEGPPVHLQPNAAITLGMALYEMAANTAAHGALSVRDGRLSISWDVLNGDRSAQQNLHFEWRETRGGTVSAPSRSGFGLKLVQRAVERELEGDVDLSFPPEGFRCNIRLPLGSRLEVV